MSRARIVLASALAITAAACGPKSSKPHPELWCPGGPGCEKGSDGTLKAGVASFSIAPVTFEKPRADFLKESGDGCLEGSPLDASGKKRCGQLVDDAWADCGLDHLCKGDKGYPGPDQGEGDSIPDFFADCGNDGLCPGDPGYPGPDADGTEGNGKFDGYWLAGYDSDRPVESVHDEIDARAIVFQSGDVMIGLVSLDVVGFFYDDGDKVRARVKELAPELAFDYIGVGANHMHDAPDALGQWGPANPRAGNIPMATGINGPWMKNVAIENAAKALVEAAHSARPTKLYAATGRMGAVQPTLIIDFRDPFVSDDAVTVMKLVDASNNQVFGTFVSWGNHPETVADANNQVTADYVHYLRESMEKGIKLPNGTQLADGLGGTCVFMNGAVGGMQSSLHAHPLAMDGTKTDDRTYAKAQAVGEHVAKVALDTLSSAPEIKSPKLAFGAHNFKFTVENKAFQLAFQVLHLFDRKIYDFDPNKDITPKNIPHILSLVSKIEIGPIHILTVPGELLPELAVGYDPKWSFGQPQVDPTNPNPPDMTKAPPGPYLKDQLGGDVRCVLGLMNDEVGYFVPPYNYELSATNPYFDQAPGDHYEETNGLGPNAVPTLLEAYKGVVDWEPE